MNIDYLYDIANKENIKIYDYNLDSSINGLFMNYIKNNYIILNKENFICNAQEYCVLSEELGHFYMNAVYPISCMDQILISKQEYRAKKWSYNVLIPYEKLKSTILNRSMYHL